jgi:2-(3-amino-3-carboxypropyl)histidine synthase
MENIKMDYDFEVERIIGEIRRNNAKLVGLQFPEGLKTYAVAIAKEIEEKTSAKTIIFIDPIYGACDTKETQAQMLGLDLVFHFGHTEMMPSYR